MRFIARMSSLVAVLAVVAVMAPAASATSQIEVFQSDGATHCGTLASGGCAVHSVGEITLFFHIIGFEGTEAKCHVEFEGKTDEDGIGQITKQTVSPGKHDADCSNATSPACSLPWDGQAELDGDGKLRAHYDVCTTPAESSTCSGEFIAEVTEKGTSTETQTQSATDIRIGSATCELTVSETSEASSPAEESHIKQI